MVQAHSELERFGCIVCMAAELSPLHPSLAPLAVIVVIDWMGL